MTSNHSDLARRAAELVLHYDKTPEQTAAILNCELGTIQDFVQEYLDHNPHLVNIEIETDIQSSFIPVLLEDEPASVSSSAIALEILTANGLTLRLQLASLHDIAQLLQELEAASC